MNLLRLLCYPVCLFLMATLACQAAPDGLRYPRNLAWRLVTEQEIQEFTGCPEDLGGEQQDAEPLFGQPRAPLGAIEAIPDAYPVMTTPQSSWEVAPFPTLDPPLPDGARGDRVKPEGNEPVVFADISTEIAEAPSAALRPRPTALGQQMLAPRSELPHPFTLRRYHARDRGFFQICLYGGSSGLEAERDFRTLRTSAPNRRQVDGVGGQAFLTVIPREPEPTAPSLTPEPSPPAAPTPGSAFEDIAPFGRVRRDLVDQGLIRASSAPAFQTIPVDLGLPEGFGATPAPATAPEPPPAPEQAVPQEVEAPGDTDPLASRNPDPFGGSVNLGQGGVQVLVALFPDKGVVLEVAMDDRIGDVQSLMRLAFLIQARLLQRW